MRNFSSASIVSFFNREDIRQVRGPFPVHSSKAIFFCVMNNRLLFFQWQTSPVSYFNKGIP
jgi:hypothetical protein